jgi:hypothetical protein
MYLCLSSSVTEFQHGRPKTQIELVVIAEFFCFISVNS